MRQDWPNPCKQGILRFEIWSNACRRLTPSFLQFGIQDISKGLTTAGTKLQVTHCVFGTPCVILEDSARDVQAASSIAQEGFFSVKVSEDSCACDGKGHGSTDFLRSMRRRLIAQPTLRCMCKQQILAGMNVFPATREYASFLAQRRLIGQAND